MKRYNILLIAIIVTFVTIASCEKKSAVSVLPAEKEDMVSATNLDLDIANMISYNDTVQVAVLHAPAHVHHYDSIYHHHDSLYIHHHDTYHHTDSTHHMGYHHTTTQHHQHDSINTAHHNIVH